MQYIMAAYHEGNQRNAFLVTNWLIPDIFTKNNHTRGGITMAQRNFKNGHAISTYPCNTGYVTEIIDTYGRVEKCVFSATVPEAKATHSRLLSNI